MDLGGWRTRSVFARYNVISEKDLGDAIERISGYVATRATERPKVRPLRDPRTKPAQSGRSRARATRGERPSERPIECAQGDSNTRPSDS